MKQIALIGLAAFGFMIVLHLCVDKPKTTKQTPPTYTNSLVISNSHFEVNEESDYIKGYKEGIQTGHENGFRSGVICAYVVISSGVQCTNIMELILKSQEYASNSVVIWKKANP